LFLFFNKISDKGRTGPAEQGVVGERVKEGRNDPNNIYTCE
jgi:hypothetical protein